MPHGSPPVDHHRLTQASAPVRPPVLRLPVAPDAAGARAAHDAQQAARRVLPRGWSVTRIGDALDGVVRLVIRDAAGRRQDVGDGTPAVQGWDAVTGARVIAGSYHADQPVAPSVTTGHAARATEAGRLRAALPPGWGLTLADPDDPAAITLGVHGPDGLQQDAPDGTPARQGWDPQTGARVLAEGIAPEDADPAHLQQTGRASQLRYRRWTADGAPIETLFLRAFRPHDPAPGVPAAVSWDYVAGAVHVEHYHEGRRHRPTPAHAAVATWTLDLQRCLPG